MGRARGWLAGLAVALCWIGGGCQPQATDDDLLADDDAATDDDDAVDDDDTEPPADICDDAPGELICDGETAVQCDSAGDIASTEECDTANGWHCWPGYGCMWCYPGTRWCDGDDVMECTADGQGGTVVETCDAGQGMVCDGGACISLCDQAVAQRQSIGCRFYGIDAYQYQGYENLPYAIVVSNVHDSIDAEVVVETKSGSTWTTHASAVIAPQQLTVFDLPNNQISDTGLVAGNAYRVQSTIPVIAYQFNPLDGVSSTTSDASLLLPTSAYDTVYRATAWGSEVPGFGVDESFIAVVAEVDGTVVTVTPSVNTEAGSGVPAGQAGVPMTPITLDSGDVLQIVNDTATAYAESLAGTVVEASQGVALFGGHRCANIPQSATACDHVEEQVFGLQAWGTEYVAARTQALADPPEIAVWQIMAGNDATTLTFDADPAVTGLPAGNTLTLAAGEVADLQVAGSADQPGDFHVWGTEAFSVTQFMVGLSLATDGDPCMVQAVPVEQFLDNYVVLVPPTWDNDRLILTRTPGDVITVDGTDVDAWSGWSQVSQVDASFEVVRLEVGDGPHVLVGSGPFGVGVAGADSYDSYCYPGGLNQQIINDL